MIVLFKCVVVLLNTLYHQNKKDTSPPLLIISFELLWTRFIIFHAHPQLIYCNYVKFHQYQSNC